MLQFPLPRVLEFVRGVAPFHTLGEGELRDVIQSMKIAFFPAGEAILRMGGDPALHLYLVHSGLVRVTLGDEDGNEILVDFRSEGEFFGSVSLLQGKKALFNVTAEEDTIAFLLPAESFKPLVEKHLEFKRHFAFSLARNFQGSHLATRGDSPYCTDRGLINLDMSLIGRSVMDLMKTNVLCCPPETTLKEAARAMTRRGVSSIVVSGEAQRPLGILTDTDMRSRVLADGLDSQAPVSVVMSGDLKSVETQDYAYDALLTMIRHNLSHLLVSEGKSLVGIISMHDLQRATGNAPLGIIADIDKSKSVDQLVALHREVMLLEEGLLRQGGPAKKLVGLIAELNDRLTLRLLDISETRMREQGRGGPPSGYCWLALGSGGRREQTLTTDQDNALAFADPEPGQEEDIKRWFLDFGELVNESLVRFGFPRDLAGMMACQPDWCHSYTEWRTKTRWWIKHPFDRTLLKASMFFDFRGLSDGQGFSRDLRAVVNEASKENRSLFLRYLAKIGLYNNPPLGFLRQFVVEKSGERKNKLDLKNKGLLPVVEIARVLAIDLDLTTTNTFERLEGIGRAQIIDPAIVNDMLESYSFLMLLRIDHHLQARASGHEPDNHINPEQLNSLQRKLLKESFGAIRRGQEELARHYLTDQLKDI
jgi:CBS domain-containing protein